MITRRKIVGAIGAGVFAPVGAFAQQPPAKVWRIGFLTPGTMPSATNRLAALRTGLRDLGYVEGKNLIIDIRASDGIRERLPALAAELIQQKPDVNGARLR